MEKEVLLSKCKALCKSGRFETGGGTCALICLDQLGDARRDCVHVVEVFKKTVLLRKKSISWEEFK